MMTPLALEAGVKGQIQYLVKDSQDMISKSCFHISKP